MTCVRWLGVVAALAAAACSGSTATTGRATTTGTATEGEVLLDQLTVEPEGSREGYDRDLFGGWTDDDGDACDTRCEALAAQRRTELPGLPDGGWLSPYDGYSTDDAGELEIDHVVAFAEAWDSGADDWDRDRRVAFGNDLAGGELLVVTAATNRSKSDRDPADWQPPNTGAWCDFAARWVRVKVAWQLTADEAEVRALRNMLDDCSPGDAP